MSSTQIHLRGKVFSIVTTEDAGLVSRALARTEELLDELVSAVGEQDMEQVYLLALLNRTMELEKMNKHSQTSVSTDDATIVNWARNLASTLERAAR